MLSYIEKVVCDLTITCVLCTLITAYCESFFGKAGKRATVIGILTGVIASAAMAVAKNTTSKIATNKWNLYIFYVGAVVTILFIIFTLAAWKKKDGKCTLIASVFGGMVNADLIFYELPDVIAYPFVFNIGDNSVFSMEYLRRFVGWALALIVLWLLCICTAKCVRTLKQQKASFFAMLYVLLINLVRYFGMILSKWVASGKKAWPYFVSKEHPWAFPIVKFVQNNKRALLMLSLAACVFMAVLLFVKSVKVTEKYDNPAQLRKLRSINRKRRRNAIFAMILVVLCVLSMTVVYAYNHRTIELVAPDEYTFSEDGTQILVPTEEVNDGHLHSFEYVTDNNVTVRWIIVKKPNAASYGIGLDACDVCGTAGYYERNGTVVCRRCDVVMNINTIGFKGGCNPIPLNYTVADGNIIFELSDIIAAEKEF